MCRGRGRNFSVYLISFVTIACQDFASHALLGTLKQVTQEKKRSKQLGWSMSSMLSAAGLSVDTGL
jgi:hypothetical protein